MLLSVIRFFRCLRIIYEGLTAISKKSPQSKKTLIQENIKFLKGGGGFAFQSVILLIINDPV
jgi:hypothetical protein